MKRTVKQLFWETLTPLVILPALLVLMGINSVESCNPTITVKGGNPTSPPCCEKCHDPNCKRSPNYIATGNYTFSTSDLQISTRGAFALSATRNYDRSRTIDGLLGIGWTASYLTHLTYATYSYSPPSTYYKEAAILMPDGITQRYRQNADGSFTPPLESHSTLVKNGDGTYDLTLSLSHSKYHYGADGSILSMIDDYGNTISFQYDGSGKLTKISDASGSGRYINVFYGGDGRISALQDHSGRSVQYNYTNGTLTSVIDPANRTTFYVYTTGRFGPVLSQIKDNWGRVITDLTYDSLDRMASYTDAGETWTYTYWATNPPANPSETDKTDTSGNSWHFQYDPVSGRVTQDRLFGPIGFTINTSYYSDGSIQQVTDAANVKTYYTYNANGSVATITRDYQGSLALRFDYAYDTNFTEKVISVTPKNPSTGVVNLDWQAWRYDYYQAGSTAPGALYHVYRVRNDGSTLDTLATYTYNSAGQVLTVTDATGGVTTYGYNPTTGDLTSVTYPKNSDSGANPVYQYGRDALGRVSSVTDPLNHATSYVYDNLDRITSVMLPKPSTSSTLNFTTTYSYDNYDAGTGLVFTNQTDPNSKITKQGYDQFGQIVKSIDSLNNTTTFTFTKGLLTSITDANNNVTSYEYLSTAAKRLTKTTFPDGTYETYDYTADGLLKYVHQRTGGGIGVNNVYDTFKRVTQYEGFILTYTGQKLTNISQDNQTLSYDSSYRVSSTTEGTQGTIGYTYDAVDRVASYTVTGGPSATYTYYADGSLKNITWSAVAGQFIYAYTLNGQYGTITFPNGQHRDYTYDDQGRLTNLANIHPSTGNLATYGYGYDVDNSTGQSTMLGQRSSLTAIVPGQGFSASLTKYYYDTSYQLVRTDYPNIAPFNGETHSWTYDAIGNRLTNTVNATTQNYTYFKNPGNPLNGQELQSDSVNSYTYDADGDTQTQVTPGGTYTFGWLYRSTPRLSSISGPVTASYTYDYGGRRKTKTVSGVQTTYLYDDQNLIRETGAATADYLFGPGIDEPLAMSRGGSIYYYDVDGRGSAALVNNSIGSVQDSYVMDAWGIVRSQSMTVPNPFIYTSRESAEGGLMFYRARYYYAGIGRLYSEDPLGPRFVENRYAYAESDPVGLDDPSGLSAENGKWEEGQYTCLLCTIFAEGREEPCECQRAMAVVIMNRLIEANRRRGTNATICSVVQKPGWFDGYYSSSYTTCRNRCHNCGQPDKISPADLEQTCECFSKPFDFAPPGLDRIYYWQTRNLSPRNHMRIAVPCKKTVFFAK